VSGIILQSKLGKGKPAMRTQIAVAISLFFFAVAVQAQLYRWTDEQGKTHYTDTPPPPSAKGVQKKSMRGNTAVTTQESYAMQEAAKNFPVTLYISESCDDPCKNGLAYLRKRGVPFAEKVVATQQQLDELVRLVGTNTVPILMVGNAVEKGFQESSWGHALDSAGYPRTGVPPIPVPGASPASKTAEK